MRSRVILVAAATTSCWALAPRPHYLSTACSAAHRCAIASLTLTLATAPAFADGAVLFETKCAACHAGGGNVVARSKTLDRAALTANNALDIEAIVTLGKNQMPGFGAACAPKPACTFGARLSDADIAEVSKWVGARADDGKWSQ